jgi:hypothetical protein
VRNLDEEAAGWAGGAVVQVTQDGETTFRPALFVYALPAGGVAWIEPSYLDPNGPGSPAFHVAAGPVVDVTPAGTADAFFEAPGTGWAATVYRADDEDAPDVIEALRVALAELQRRGTTWEDERARLLAEISAAPA